MRAIDQFYKRFAKESNDKKEKDLSVAVPSVDKSKTGVFKSRYRTVAFAEGFKSVNEYPMEGIEKVTTSTRLLKLPTCADDCLGTSYSIISHIAKLFEDQERQTRAKGNSGSNSTRVQPVAYKHIQQQKGDRGTIHRTHRNSSDNHTPSTGTIQSKPDDQPLLVEARYTDPNVAFLHDLFEQSPHTNRSETHKDHQPSSR